MLGAIALIGLGVYVFLRESEIERLREKLIEHGIDPDEENEEEYE